MLKWVSQATSGADGGRSLVAAWPATGISEHSTETIAFRITTMLRPADILVFIIVPSCLLRLARRHSTGSVPPVNPRQVEVGKQKAECGNFEEIGGALDPDRKSTRLNSSHLGISY